MTWDDVVEQTTDCWASEKALLAQQQKFSSCLQAGVFRTEMPHDTVNVADFADVECKASAKSVAVCAMREQQQIYGAETKCFCPVYEKEAVQKMEKAFKRDL